MNGEKMKTQTAIHNDSKSVIFALEVYSCAACLLTLMLSYTAAAFSGLLLWCLKANSVSTIPGDIHCRGGKPLHIHHNPMLTAGH